MNSTAGTARRPKRWKPSSLNSSESAGRLALGFQPEVTNAIFHPTILLRSNFLLLYVKPPQPVGAYTKPASLGIVVPSDTRSVSGIFRFTQPETASRIVPFSYNQSSRGSPAVESIKWMRITMFAGIFGASVTLIQMLTESLMLMSTTVPAGHFDSICEKEPHP